MENYTAFRKHIENNLNDARTKLNLWKSVKRLSKKNGEDFANFGKNFDGATIDPYVGEDVLKVYGRIEHGIAWTEDHIELIREATPDIEEERRIHYYGDFYKYHLTVSEAFEKIEARIRYFETQVANYELQLRLSETIYNTVVRRINGMYAELLEEIISEGYEPTYDIDTPSILYNVHDLLEHAFPPHMTVDKEKAATLNKYRA